MRESTSGRWAWTYTHFSSGQHPFPAEVLTELVAKVLQTEPLPPPVPPSRDFMVVPATSHGSALHDAQRD